MKDGEEVWVKGVVTQAGEGWLMVRVNGVRGVEYVRPRLEAVKPAEPEWTDGSKVRLRRGKPEIIGEAS